jgi:hypothetical protein
MIYRHDFNSRWWGADVGIVRDPRFFGLPKADREGLLARFAWAEWRGEPGIHPGGPEAAGFWWADVQVKFKIALRRVEITDSESAIEVRPGAFDLRERVLEPFAAERFSLLPGVTPALVTFRYLDWARGLVAAEPSWCMELHYDGLPQGFYCAAPSAAGLHLALAGRYADAVVSGETLYRAALAWYAATGARIGYAGYSIRNLAAQNVYGRLGARTVGIEACWLWTPKKPAPPAPVDLPARASSGPARRAPNPAHQRGTSRRRALAAQPAAVRRTKPAGPSRSARTPSS